MAVLIASIDPKTCKFQSGTEVDWLTYQSGSLNPQMPISLKRTPLSCDED